MKSIIVRHSINLGGHLTSISLEDEFWQSLRDIAASQRLSLRNLVSKIDLERKHGNLSSAVRLFVLNHYKQRCHDTAPIAAPSTDIPLSGNTPHDRAASSGSGTFSRFAAPAALRGTD
jgi:predicted DNA-binding ribbon-helix-helix protein